MSTPTEYSLFFSLSPETQELSDPGARISEGFESLLPAFFFEPFGEDDVWPSSELDDDYQRWYDDLPVPLNSNFEPTPTGPSSDDQPPLSLTSIPPQPPQETIGLTTVVASSKFPESSKDDDDRLQGRNENVASNYDGICSVNFDFQGDRGLSESLSESLSEPKHHVTSVSTRMKKKRKHSNLSQDETVEWDENRISKRSKKRQSKNRPVDLQHFSSQDAPARMASSYSPSAPIAVVTDTRAMSIQPSGSTTTRSVNSSALASKGCSTGHSHTPESFINPMASTSASSQSNLIQTSVETPSTNLEPVVTLASCKAESLLFVPGGATPVFKPFIQTKQTKVLLKAKPSCLSQGPLGR